ncbi:hypothetical protein A3B85_02410 [Candidatus Nomurabacteria bacterium RIFCSPHIGHO2_02_FULL_37_13]|uniref:Uncharacterized protein n=1 Tax=Candidatus Nomurabacteria bacterium RIFCSPHIGHO2_02_FULL_37_13 TaxID=1801750 RepID=A0A1F6W4B1_9BACT|nr:MAG: hypothetical protein A2640_00690 [Candidatus Nomurabacteria bacterium RIFCSPHIGHO2_01_FULL_36_23]OGI76753.1 MAG: hypothetical protein A3B85_02410 [Candidatus Nomurabacteria bacterium RIFCSPHIGHO2_02_FULL_37_13]
MPQKTPRLREVFSLLLAPPWRGELFFVLFRSFNFGSLPHVKFFLGHRIFVHCMLNWGTQYRLASEHLKDVLGH